MNSFGEPRAFDFRSLNLRLGRGQFAATLLIIAASSLGAFWIETQFGEVASALIFVLGITVAGSFYGLTSALIAAAAAFLLYNFYLTEPVLTLRLATGRDVAPLIIFNLCAVITGVLAGRLNDRAQAANRSNRHLTSLLEASQALQSAVRLEDIADALRVLMPVLVDAEVIVFRLTDDGHLVALGPDRAEARTIAELSRTADQPDGRAGDLVAHRLVGGSGLVGMLVVGAAEARRFEPAFLPALASLIALALERARFSEIVAENRAAARTEELKTALLSSVSHDFRTPLTAISASASSLIAYREQLDRETSAQLLRGIVDECERLNRYTANLLEMSRLEAGQPHAHAQSLGVTEMLAAVVQRIRGRAPDRQIDLVAKNGELVVNADAALFELVLINVLENAILYSGEGSPILVQSEADGAFCRVSIADEGQGIPDEDLDRVFDRFFRVARAEASPRGSGLGLAIAKGFVEALGGTIAASTPGLNGRGTCIDIRLPLAIGDPERAG